ncbi:hypothetical protein HWV62_3687 [Athelia sp. TMB]|nr:hypothetical protein HWV62_3687 [Athelia sp. TMB]
MRTMLYLQLIIQMQSQLAESEGSSNILSKPEHILSFVKHTLSTSASRESEPNSHHDPKVDTLLIVPEDDHLSEDGDSDDEDSIVAGTSSNDEVVDTAINLLLAILETNEGLSARTAPILNDIFALLEPFANVQGTTQTLAREARMVMTARLASTSSIGPRTGSKHSNEMKAQETYQKAIKLLQDPILPVRAHGLLLLRQLVNPKLANMQGDTFVDPALVPSIMAIFLQAIQDDDSYMFLNAVQGFAAMVETFGNDVLKILITEYSGYLDGLSGSSLTQADVDKRTRIGEALGQVIKRFGTTLGIYANVLIPPLEHVFRAHHVPIALRTSALSLLSDCATTDPLVFAGYASGLSDAMIDLLQVERAVERPEAAADKGKNSKSESEPQPTSSDSKLPALRRAALHLYTQLIRASTSQMYESSYSSQTFSTSQIRRAKTTLLYVAATDRDAVVRVMASEAIEHLRQLSEALAGL